MTAPMACSDGALTIAPITAQFRATLPEAAISASDDGSSDGTAEIGVGRAMSGSPSVLAGPVPGAVTEARPDPECPTSLSIERAPAP